jgi:hypothetical protein
VIHSTPYELVHHTIDVFEVFGTALPEKIGFFSLNPLKIVPASPNASYDAAGE